MKWMKITAIGVAAVLSLLCASLINRSTASDIDTAGNNTDKSNAVNAISNGPISGGAISGGAKSDSVDVEGGFAVAELFTSEGCSSCPPAEEILARVQQASADKPVYVLAYHVDYWDRLGWKDVFSDARYSKRQYEYSGRFTGEVYTPQVIVNGKAECVGSDENAVHQVLSNIVKEQSSLGLRIAGEQQADKMTINYELTGDKGNGQLVIAVVQKSAVSTVLRGENKGRTLTHAQIVRDLQVFDLSRTKKGTERVRLPKEFNSQDWELIGMVQDETTGVISAATRVHIN